ncbi:MAG: sugar-binding protein [Planctomycetes bacterium]|nr:sugar-binding protein [Planctomycetota bacterium]MCH9726708.1 sugar-binding protein [Planctomycetota bacterium]MCH9779616.1 sugar-binding protein [Planctomycetota bacterium]MDF1746079.1 sugar-binding protein [Gimesia sp.]
MTCRKLIRNCTLFITILSISIAVPGCNQDKKITTSETSGSKSEKKKTVAYVTNGIASFWVIAQKGAEKAGTDLDVNVEVRMPPKGVSDQKRMVQELLAQGVDGIAISPIDPDNQNDLLQEIADNSILITQDSDAPESPRQCYIGMDNYKAGRMCGELVKEALPDGGEIMLFVGRLGQANARLRRQGVIDEVMGRSDDNTRYDKPGEPIKNDKYTILDTRLDDFDFPQAKANAQDAIAKYPNLKCMVGLFAYNPPLCLEAIRDAGKLNEIKVVSFDEEGPSLQGIIDGTVVGTVVQNPYQYGYESVRVLKALAEGDKSVIPENKIIHIPARKITKKNVKEFWAELKSLVDDVDQKEEGKAKSEKEASKPADDSKTTEKKKAAKSDE